MWGGGGRRGLILIAGDGDGCNIDGVVVIVRSGYGLAVALTHRGRRRGEYIICILGFDGGEGEGQDKERSSIIRRGEFFCR